MRARKAAEPVALTNEIKENENDHPLFIRTNCV
jgi:hypothetical protein